MSGLSGRKIKFIALALGVICAIMFAALAYAGFADGSAVSGICFAVLSLVSLIAIYPGYIIGKLVDDVNALDESSRMQNERLFRIQKESEKLYYFSINILDQKKKTLPIPSGKCSMLIDKL